MKSLDLVSCCVAAAMLTGCGGSQPPTAAPGAMTQSRAIATHAARDGSWMLPEAKSEDLLYVSSQPGSGSKVYVYDYKLRTQVGTLTGFEDAYGQCVDKIGDVWITDMGAKTIIEYAHGGTAPLKTLDTAGNPLGCSVAPNGDLALAEGFTGIEIFSYGSSTGTIYKNHLCDSTWTPGYDLNGNLYFEGKQYSRYSYKVNVCELPAGASSIRRVSFNNKITGLASVMWDGKYLTLTDVTNSLRTYVYQARESSSGNLTHIGTTQLFDGTCNGTEVLQALYSRD
jgi:hypothetical protein